MACSIGGGGACFLLPSLPLLLPPQPQPQQQQQQQHCFHRPPWLAPAAPIPPHAVSPLFQHKHSQHSERQPPEGGRRDRWKPLQVCCRQCDICVPALLRGALIGNVPAAFALYESELSILAIPPLSPSVAHLSSYFRPPTLHLALPLPPPPPNLRPSKPASLLASLPPPPALHLLFPSPGVSLPLPPPPPLRRRRRPPQPPHQASP